MATVPDRYLAMDDEGYFIFDQTKVTDPEVGRPLLENIKPLDEAGARFVTSMKGEKAWLEAFDAPFVARHVSAGSSTHGMLDLPYGVKTRFEFSTLSVDEWDRFHGRSEAGIPFVFSRQAQIEFFELLEEFDDESVTIKGQRYPVPQWLNPAPEVSQDKFWSELYTTGKDGWEEGRESVVLPTVLPQLKLNRQRVLVLGCGSGHDAAYLAKQGHVVTAMDFSNEAVQRAKTNYSSLENLKIMQGDALQLPSSMNERFDLVFEHTLYCAIPPERRNDIVKVWNRALHPQGNLLGVFFTMEKPVGPPFGGSEWEIRERLKPHFDFLFWTRWRHSIESRKGRELVVFARKKTR